MKTFATLFSHDVHVRPEVSRACCGLRFVLEALRRICRVIYLHLRAELLQLAGVVTRDVAVRGPFFRGVAAAGLCVTWCCDEVVRVL